MSGFVHITKDGRKIPLEELDSTHLFNIIKYIERAAENGIEVLRDTYDWESVWECSIYGDSVLFALGYAHYVQEALRRGMRIKPKYPEYLESQGIKLERR